MSRNNEYAGMHFVRRGRQSFDPGDYDKYGDIISEQMMKETYSKNIHVNNYALLDRSAKQKSKEALKKENERKKEEFFKDIELCNFIVLWNRKGQESRCLCGGVLCFQDNVPVRFHKNGKMQEILVTAKVCKDCGRKFVVKNLIEEAVKKREYRPI